MDIEQRRDILETLDRIEEALVARVKRSDTYIPATINSTKKIPGKRNYSARENAVRRWETAKLVERYNDVLKNWDNLPNVSTKLDFNSELAAANLLDDEAPAVSLAKEFSMNSHYKGRKRFLCDYTEFVLREVDSKYPTQESFGQFVDLEPFYQELIASEQEEKPVNYREYLVDLQKYIKKDSCGLLQYLVEFYNRAYSLGYSSGTTAEELLTNTNSTTTNNSSEFYCKVCSHNFSNKNVFNAHLNGKKHKRAALNQKAYPKQVHVPQIQLESNIEELYKLVEPALKNTIANIDRKSGMSILDRRLEVEALERERELEDAWQSDEDSTSNNINDPPLNDIYNHKPLKGPQGTPIPRWLYRLQGLRTTFTCEICGPGIKYAGRKTFEHHFNQPFHLNGLKKLSIIPSPAFNGISNISEAKELSVKLNTSKPKSTIEKEVEDDDGNALTERMYEDLKKQGLL